MISKRPALLVTAVIAGFAVMSACHPGTRTPSAKASSEPLLNESVWSESTVRSSSSESIRADSSDSAEGAATPHELRERATAAIESGDWLSFAKVSVPEERAAIAAVALLTIRGLLPSARRGLAQELDKAKATGQLDSLATAAMDHELSKYDQAVQDVEALIGQTWTSIETLTQLLQQAALAELNQRFPDPLATLWRLAEIQRSVRAQFSMELFELSMNAPLADVGTELQAPVAWGEGYVLMTKLATRLVREIAC